ncbi:hypothetical protein R5R35_012137 [Gryllus longicercus]|uniref:Kazal-like domain-containing protein n=1 Tax=Gryllus longicercus TaxID=2509291 RepID=A0AAN9YVX2_9ORTH
MRRMRLLLVIMVVVAASTWLMAGTSAEAEAEAVAVAEAEAEAGGGGGGRGGTNCMETCPTRNAPLCARQGSNGSRKNFANQCELERYNCRFGQNLRKIKDGSC